MLYHFGTLLYVVRIMNVIEILRALERDEKREIY